MSASHCVEPDLTGLASEVNHKTDSAPSLSMCQGAYRHVGKEGEREGERERGSPVGRTVVEDSLEDNVRIILKVIRGGSPVETK